MFGDSAVFACCKVFEQSFAILDRISAHSPIRHPLASERAIIKQDFAQDLRLVIAVPARISDLHVCPYTMRTPIVAPLLSWSMNTPVDSHVPGTPPGAVKLVPTGALKMVKIRVLPMPFKTSGLNQFV